MLARLAERAAVRHPNPRQDPAAARGAIERLVSSTSRDQHGSARALVRQALAVDMTKAPNRKGELPAALGLVSRSDSAEARRHRAIVLMMDRVLDTPIVDDSARCANRCERLTTHLLCHSRKEWRRTFVFPNFTQAAQAVLGNWKFRG